MVGRIKSVKTLFLDLDGTLVNSLPRLKLIYQDFLHDFEKEGSHEEFSQLKTSSFDKIIKHFKTKYKLIPSSFELKKEYESYIEKHYFKAPLFRGAKDFLEFSKELDLTIYLTTACKKDFASKILSLHKVEHYFDDILTPHCFALSQKNKHFYSTVIKKVKAQESEVLVIDDSLEVIALTTEMGLLSYLFSKITYHPLPSFGSWKALARHMETLCLSEKDTK